MPTTYAIPDGRVAMSATTYAGSASTQVINSNMTTLNFAWIKDRTSANSNALVDTVRGGSPMLTLYSNLTAAEDNSSPNYNPTSISGSSITLGGGKIGINTSGDNYVMWGWSAGPSNVSNTNGSITSTVSANTTAGFSIVSYTGNGSTGTVGHGLGSVPKMMIIKERSTIRDWIVYHVILGAGNRVFLNLTDASGASTTNFNNTTPTSSVFSIGATTATNENGGTYVAYCFAEIPGYSAFGSYTGNASADGPFIYLGFRPRFIMIKNATTAGYGWVMEDTSRDPYNTQGIYLLANTSGTEGTTIYIDYLSNGFKVRTGTQPAINNSGDTFIYAAFAENPFKYANAR